MKLIAVLALALMTGLQEAPPDDRLYGRVYTSGGNEYEGYIRWDRNEGSWADLLDGSKEIPWQNLRQAEDLDEEYGRRRQRTRGIRFLGIRISWDEDEDEITSARSGIRFGHVRTLEVLNRRSALLILKSGEQVEFSGGSTDIGRSLRALIIEDPEEGEIELRWRDLESIDFMEPPSDLPEPSTSRLYGTMQTYSGLEFTGYVAWDTDEIFGSDVLDGEEDGHSRRIPFDRIASIERAGSSAARVILTNGEEMTLRGTNDVNDGNRGVAISDPALGQVVADWDEFETITFHRPATSVGAYSDFDGGHRLYGVVETDRGREFEGFVRWDNDEEYTWEILNGVDGGLDFDIEFGQVETVRKLGSWGAEVTLRDGRTFELEGSNDVDRDNKGIFVEQEDGSLVLVRWDDFERLTLAR